MKRSWLEVESHDQVPYDLLCGLTAACVSWGCGWLQGSWAHPLIESAVVSTASGRCRISTHRWPPPLQDGLLS